MAHVKSGGSTSLGRDSRSKRLGVKLYAGQYAQAGNVIIRQKGTKFRPGKNVKKCKDDTLMALLPGLIEFKEKKVKRFTGCLKKVKFVNVIPVKNK